MTKEQAKPERNILNNPYAIVSALLTVLSVIAYYIPGFFDRQYHLAPDEFKILLIIPASLAAIASIAAIAAIVKVRGRWKILFVLFLFLCLAISGITLAVASLIGAVG